jgi:hypothetical protein
MELGRIAAIQCQFRAAGETRANILNLPYPWLLKMSLPPLYIEY